MAYLQEISSNPHPEPNQPILIPNSLASILILSQLRNRRPIQDFAGHNNPLRARACQPNTGLKSADKRCKLNHLVEG